jgi:hypothetical protein
MMLGTRLEVRNLITNLVPMVLAILSWNEFLGDPVVFYKPTLLGS